MYLVINKCVTAVKVSNFSGHYLRNRSNLDIGVLAYLGSLFVPYTAVCYYRRFVCMSGAAVRVGSGHRFYDQIPPGQQLQTHTQTDDNDIRPYTAQTHNERTSTESNLVTTQCTVHEPPEDGRKYGPKYVVAT